MTAQPGPPTKKPLLARISAKQWVAIVLSLLAVIFVVQNWQYTQVHLLGFTIGAPMTVVLVVTLAVGWAAGWLITRSRRPRA